MGRSIPYFLALWQDDKCSIALPIHCAVGTKQRKPRNSYSGGNVPRIGLYLLPDTDIEQVLREKKPVILRRKLDGIKKLPGRMLTWHRGALSVSITWA